MTVDYFYVRLRNKSYSFIRTESRFFDTTNCRIFTDDEIYDRDGLAPPAIPVSDLYVAELVANAIEVRTSSTSSRAKAKALIKSKTKGRAAKIRNLRKEEGVV